MFKLLIPSFGNAAFGDHREDQRAEVARILRELADKVAYGPGDSGPVRDANGNWVGNWSADYSEGGAL